MGYKIVNLLKLLALKVTFLEEKSKKPGLKFEIEFSLLFLRPQCYLNSLVLGISQKFIKTTTDLRKTFENRKTS